MMWEIVLADGRVNEFEDNLMWRAADLLGGLLATDRVAPPLAAESDAASRNPANGDRFSELG